MLKGKMEREDRRGGGGILGTSRISPFRFWPWECILKYTTNPCITNETVQSPKHKDQICQCWGKIEAVTQHCTHVPPAKKRLMCPMIGPCWAELLNPTWDNCIQTLLELWPKSDCGNEPGSFHHHTPSSQSLSSRSWQQRWASHHSWKSCKGKALLARSLVNQTHRGSHLHVLRLPTVVPNKQQTNWVRLKLISTHQGTDAEHWLTHKGHV